MAQKQVSSFGATATFLSRSPLGIIALFIVLVYGLASLVVITGGSLSQSERLPIIYFLVFFPVAVLGVFTYLVAYKAGNLFGPSDFRTDAGFNTAKENASKAEVSLALALAKVYKGNAPRRLSSVEIAKVTDSADKGVDRIQDSDTAPIILWVDDNPSNNTYERQAFEASGFRFVLSETTEDALTFLRRRHFDAVISDMGRREGPREGYALLDAMRGGKDETPLFFYAASNAPEHIEETRQHGGQGCTNDGEVLFDMVTKAVLSAVPRGARRGGSRGRRRGVN